MTEDFRASGRKRSNVDRWDAGDRIGTPNPIAADAVIPNHILALKDRIMAEGPTRALLFDVGWGSTLFDPDAPATDRATGGIWEFSLPRHRSRPRTGSAFRSPRSRCNSHVNSTYKLRRK